MNLHTSAKYRLSSSGSATEVMLCCHGAWTTDDGRIYVPKGMVINFYSPHGQFGTKGVPIAEHLSGLTAPPELDMALANKIMMEGMTKGWSKDKLDEELDKAIMHAKADVNASGMSDSMSVVESVRGQGFGARQEVYNYNLGYTGPSGDEQRFERLFTQHQGGTGNAAVDLMIMQPQATGHLASAIKFARSHTKYVVFHFLPCRYVNPKDAKAMKTVPVDLSDLDVMSFKTLDLEL